MTDNFPPCVAFTLVEEGSYSDDAGDPGGPTNFGITLATLSHWRGRTCTAADVRGLEKPEASTIYQALYWMVVRGWALPLGVDLMVFDFAVNAGPQTSALELQQAVGAAQDSIVGPMTALAARGAGVGLIETLYTAHVTHYRGLADFDRFGSDWLGRAARCRDTALKMAAPAATTQGT